MINFYKSQRMAFNHIDGVIITSIKNKTDLDINQLILDITSKYEISDKAIKKRLNYWANARNDILILTDNELKVKRGEINENQS